MLQQTH